MGNQSTCFFKIFFSTTRKSFLFRNLAFTCLIISYFNTLKLNIKMFLNVTCDLKVPEPAYGRVSLGPGGEGLLYQRGGDARRLA